MKQSEQIGQLIAALALAKLDFHPILRDKRAGKEGEKFSYMYSPIENVLAAVTTALSSNQLALIGDVELSPDGVLSLMTRLVHESDQFIETTIPVGRITGDVKAIGSAITYGRRYGITTLLQVAADDDDDDGDATESGQSSGRKSVKPLQTSAAPITTHEVAAISVDEVKSLSQLAEGAGFDTIKFGDDMRLLLGLEPGAKLTRKFLCETMTREQYEERWQRYTDLIIQAEESDDVPDFSGPEDATQPHSDTQISREGGSGSDGPASNHEEPSTSDEAITLGGESINHGPEPEPSAESTENPIALEGGATRVQWGVLSSRSQRLGLSKATWETMRQGSYEDALDQIDAIAAEKAGPQRELS